MTAVAAADAVKRGNDALIAAISDAVRDGELYFGGVTAFQIAARVAECFPNRWDEGSVRTRVSAMHHDGLLCHVDNDGRHKGRSVRRYVLATEAS